jgi:hypothetical protein
MVVSLYTISNEPLCILRRYCNETTNAIDDVLKTVAILSTISVLLFHGQTLAACLFQNVSYNRLALTAALYTVIITNIHGIIVYAIYTLIKRWKHDDDIKSLYMATYILAFITSGLKVGWIVVLLCLRDTE